MIYRKYLLPKAFRILLFFFIVCSSHAALAISPLPGSVEPGRVTQNYLPTRPTGAPHAQPNVTHPEEKTSQLGPEAEKIKFKLNKVILEGNHVYTSKELAALYQDKLNTIISIAELEQIVQDITNYYRNNGYILSRAILPPQHVKDGIVHIRIIEGYIDKVKIVGNPRGAERILLDYGQKISESRPLQLKDMEYYLLLANQVPGVQAKAILEPSKTETGASDLNIAVEEQRVSAFMSYDNYGTLYIGPHQVTAGSSVNSVVRSGDMTRATYLAATHGAELHYLDVAYQTPLGAHGLQLTVGGNQSLTAPGFVLGPLDTDGIAKTYYITLQYPFILSRSQNLILDGGFTYLDSKTTQLDTLLLYNDHIRPIKFGGTYSFGDRFGGSDSLAFHIEQGLNVLGASDDPTSLTTSRFGADGIYTKYTAQATHLQPLFSSPFSIFLLAQGQSSNNPLLASEQFGFGGSVIGRGYDPAELLGDRGADGSIEFRWDTFPNRFLIQNIQFYLFYDIGEIWNIKELPGVKQFQSASSTGGGARFALTKYVSGNVMFTQVLTKSIASEELINRGRNPKTFFSLVASV